MGEYRQVHHAFWNDNLIVSLEPKERYFYLYLITNAHTNQLGCYEISKAVIYREVGYTPAEIDNLIESFENKYKRIEYDDTTGEMLIKNMYKYNWSFSPKVITHNLKLYEKLKTPKFKQYLHNILIDYVRGIGTYSFRSKRSIITEVQKEEEQEKEKFKEKEEETGSSCYRGEYGNVYLPMDCYSELLELCGNDELMLNIEINKLSGQIYMGRIETFNFSNPQQHYLILKDQINAAKCLTTPK